MRSREMPSEQKLREDALPLTDLEDLQGLLCLTLSETYHRAFSLFPLCFLPVNNLLKQNAKEHKIILLYMLFYERFI